MDNAVGRYMKKIDKKKKYKTRSLIYNLIIHVSLNNIRVCAHCGVRESDLQIFHYLPTTDFYSSIMSLRHSQFIYRIVTRPSITRLSDLVLIKHNNIRARLLHYSTHRRCHRCRLIANCWRHNNPLHL